MIEVSRRLERIEHSAASGGDPPATVEIEARTPAWQGARPRVSVITALYNHAEHVGAALDSVARGRYPRLRADRRRRRLDRRLARGGARLDGAQPRRRRRCCCATRSTAACRRAATAAIAFARGEHVLVLDSDNELYPHCLERLVAALDADPEAAFAYGILEKFDDNGPRGLIGFLGWDPERLRLHNYIDALALVRRSVLREVDGFTDRPAPLRLGGLRPLVQARRPRHARRARQGDRRPLPRVGGLDDQPHEHVARGSRGDAARAPPRLLRRRNDAGVTAAG